MKIQDELYQLENKQAKGDKLCANIRLELEDKKCSKTFLKVLERQNLQNQTISELYTDEYSNPSNPKEISRSTKKIYEKIFTKDTSSKAATTGFLNKTPNRKKISNEQINLCEAKISLYEIIKSINS